MGWGSGHCLVSVRENVLLKCARSCREVQVHCCAWGAVAFLGHTQCDHEGATGLEWVLKCAVFWSLTALLTPRNHSSDFVVPASRLLGLNTAKCVRFCDFDVVLMYFL